MKRLAILALGLVGCEPDDTCEPATGAIVEGQSVITAPAPTPFKIVARVDATRVVDAVRAVAPDGYVVEGQFNAATGNRWELLLHPSDLERFRGSGDDLFTARIPVVAADACEPEIPLGESVVALGPPPGVTITNLALDADLPDCYAPAGTAVPFDVTADPAARGAVVTLSGAPGTWQPSTTLSLAGDPGAAPSARAFFTPSAAGPASILASSGSASDAVLLRVAGPPTATATYLAPVRGQTSVVDFRTAGNFRACTARQTHAGAAVVTFQAQDRAPVVAGDAAVDVALAPGCEDAEQVHAQVTFAPTAPDGAAVVLQCAETSYGRAAELTVTAPARGPVAVSDLALSFSPPPPDCYIPATGGFTQLVDVAASAASAGGMVALSATNGTLAPATVTLQPRAGGAGALSAFTPTTPGIATITAHAQQLQLTVATAPAVTATASSPPRGTTSYLMFSTAGNFESCVAFQSTPGAAAVSLQSPVTAPLAGTPVSVRSPDPSCATPERVDVAVTFAAGAPAGASVTVRCDETAYGRAAALTVTVAP